MFLVPTAHAHQWHKLNSATLGARGPWCNLEKITRAALGDQDVGVWVGPHGNRVITRVVEHANDAHMEVGGEIVGTTLLWRKDSHK